MGHECFLPTAAEDVMKSMTHSSAVSDGVTDDGIVHNGCQHTQSEPSSSIWRITAEEAEYILTYKPDGTFLVREMSGKAVSDLSSSSINTHDICMCCVSSPCHHGNWCLLFVQCQRESQGCTNLQTRTLLLVPQ